MNTSNPRIARCLQIIVSLVLALTVARNGYGETFTVNSRADRVDKNPGDGKCDTGNTIGGQPECTLRAAIEQSNATPGDDVINLTAGNYNLTLGELVIDDNLTIRGEGAGTLRSDGTIIGGTIINGNRLSSVFPKFRVLQIGLDLLVCDTVNHSVLRYGAQSGRFIEAFVPSRSGGLNFPGAATLGPGGDLFVGSFLSGVHRYDRTTGNPKGRFTASNTGASLEATDLGFDGVSFFVADFLGENFLPPGSILRFDEGTNAFIEFIPPGSGGLASPNSLAFAFTQNLTPNRFALYVTSVGPDAVLRYDSQTGTFIDTFVSAGSGGLSRSRGLAFGPDGNLYVVSELNDRILRYDGRTGAFIDTFVSPGSGGLDRPTDLTFGPDGNLYVTSRSSGGPREVLRFDGQTGAFIDIFIPVGRGGLGSAGCLLFERGVGTGPTVEVHGVTIQNGDSSFGGGIVISEGSTLALTRSIVNSNRASDSGAGIFNEGTLNVTESTITRNGFPQRGGGGIINSGGTVTLERSTIDNNSAVGGGFRGGGGIENIGGTLTITNSTISGNSLTGGVSSRGGGIRNAGGATLNLTNVTIANNSVAAGTGNVVRRGGGIFNEANSTVNLTTTIIDGNRAPTGPDCFGTLSSSGSNLISNTADCNILGNINIQRAELAPLADNGGPTRTHALSSTSQAIDTGNNAVCPTIDQRRFTRPVDGDRNGTTICDIGAFEFGGVPLQPVNALVTFTRQPETIKTTAPTGCPEGFEAKLSFEATLPNTSSSTLSNLAVEVITLTGGNLLREGDGIFGGVGTILAVPPQGSFADGLLGQGESIDVPFVICLKEKKPFTFFVDVLGVVK
jgi:CSLREA domain-containing protein